MAKKLPNTIKVFIKGIGEANVIAESIDEAINKLHNRYQIIQPDKSKYLCVQN